MWSYNVKQSSLGKKGTLFLPQFRLGRSTTSNIYTSKIVMHSHYLYEVTELKKKEEIIYNGVRELPLHYAALKKKHLCTITFSSKRNSSPHSQSFENEIKRDEILKVFVSSFLFFYKMSLQNS